MVKCMNKGCGANGRECCQGDKDGVTCYGYMPPKTNADRIRSMTDEELAKWLNNMQGYSYNCGLIEARISEYPNRYNAWLDWLRAEVN